MLICYDSIQSTDLHKKKMKYNLTRISTLLFFLIQFALAATSQYYIDPLKYGNGQNRLVGSCDYEWNLNSLQWDGLDSFRYAYGTSNERIKKETLFMNNNQWENKAFSTYVYDTAGRVIEQLDSSYIYPNQIRRFSNTYDANGKLLIQIEKQYTNMVWTDLYRYQYTYNAAGKMLVKLSEWNNNGIWQNFERVVITYNNLGKDSIRMYEKWPNGANTWNPASKILYSYDAAGNKVADMSAIWNTTYQQYVNGYYNIYTYTGQNQVSSETNKYWNSVNNTWRNQYYHEFKYNTQGLLDSAAHAGWDTIQQNWLKPSIYYYTYNADLWLIQESDFSWNTAANSYKEFRRLYYTYNGNGYCTNMSLDNYDMNLMQWRTDYKLHFWYEAATPTGLDMLTKSNQSLTIYPVPSAHSFTVEMPKNYKQCSIAVYDLKGRMMFAAHNIQSTPQFSLGEQLSPGMYLIQSTIDGQVYRNKVVKH